MNYGDLTTFDDVKAWLQVTAIDAGDFPLLQDLITSASDWIHNWTGRFFPIADYEEIRDGTGGRDLIFANYPVLSVASVNVDTIEIPPAPTTIAAGYLFSPTRVTLRNYRFTRANMNTVIGYTAGFARVPPAISQACVELVAQKYRERSRIGVKQETIVGVDSFTYNVQDLLPNTLTALKQQRNVTPISGSSRRLAPTQTDPGLIAGAL